jgi:CheY-like chemotaxis protein
MNISGDHPAMGLESTESLDGNRSPSLSILVVDDDELNRRLMRVLLTNEGHRVEVAANGLEALESVKQHKFDIVFMDLNMPIMGGMEASRQIRAWEKNDSHTFIVALTASYLPEEGQLMFEAGMDNFISKPFQIEQIQKLLKYSSPETH